MRRTQAVGALVGLVGGLLLLLAPAAGAQTGYPPGSCTAVTGSQNVGDVTVGQQFVLQIAPTCLFDPGATVNINANGVTFTDTAEQNGFVQLTVNVLSNTELSINPVVPARCGTNTVTASGPSASAVGGIATQTANFNLICQDGAAATTVPKSGQGLLSRTGADSAGFVAVALVLVAAGSTAVLLTRRRRTTA
jgi:hypothetical protein